MIYLIGGASHTGKTLLAQQLLEKTGFPYLSIDHLKMGLIRTGLTSLGTEQDTELTKFLWPIVREIIKTAIENHQNLIVEGLYIPFDWRSDFPADYRKEIADFWLIMSADYIRSHKEAICFHANDIEKRVESDVDFEELIEDNQRLLDGCQKYGCRYILIDQDYPGALANQAVCS